jgi:hypothetical protein
MRGRISVPADLATARWFGIRRFTTTKNETNHDLQLGSKSGFHTFSNCSSPRFELFVQSVVYTSPEKNRLGRDNSHFHPVSIVFDFLFVK